MRRFVFAVAFVVALGPAVHAQDRLIQLGWLWELSGADLTRLRPMPLMPVEPSAVVVAGSRYVVAPVYLGQGTAALGYLDVISGTQGLVPGVSLELADRSSWPVFITNDPRRPRVFIWHGSRISEFSASTGLRDIITGLPELPYFSPRQLAYSAAADVLALALPGETLADASELIIARATTGEELRRHSIGGVVRHLAADPRSSRLIVTWSHPLELTAARLDLPHGALTTLPYAPPSFDSGPTIDATNHRLLFSRTDRLIATTDNGVVLGELTTGTGRQITSVLGVSAATGRTFAQSYFLGGSYLPSGPCLLHVVEPMGQALAPIDLSARAQRLPGIPCDTGVLLAAPGAPGAPAAAVAGANVALSWEHPGNVERFELEAQTAGTTRLFELGLEPSFAIDAVPAGTYRLRVRGRNAIGVGPWSAATDVVVTPAAPAGQLPTVRAMVQ